ncbi:MAG: tetratricopeptide repeat protein, partial [Waterburya sp.]
MFNSKNTITNRDVAQELLKRGVYKFQTGNYSNALKVINQAIEIKPNYYEALIIRASLIYPLLNNYQGIIEDWTQVIKINPTNSEAYNNRGFA